MHIEVTHILLDCSHVQLDSQAHEGGQDICKVKWVIERGDWTQGEKTIRIEPDLKRAVQIEPLITQLAQPRSSRR